MKQVAILCFFVITSITSFSQLTYKIKADSVKITNSSSNAELILENSTKNVKGFLYNKGNGTTEFRRGAVKVPGSDTLYVIGGDTISISSGGSGNMILASAQSVTGLKTFDKDKLAMKGTSTGVTTISTANTSATNYTVTLPATNITAAQLTLLTTAASSPTASVLMQRDANANVGVSNLTDGYTTTTTGSTTNLTVSSKYYQQFTGSGNQIVVLPNATTLTAGMQYQIVNNSTGTVTVNANTTGSLVKTITAGNAAIITVTNVGTAAGVWDVDYSSDPLKADLVAPFFTTPNIGVATGTSLAVTNGITSSGSVGIGYATGAGGTVTQATNKSTGVTINKICGKITMNAANLTAGSEVSFTVTNSTVGANDNVIVNHSSGGTAGSYGVYANAISAGSFSITITNLSGGTLGQAIVITFSVIKAVNN